MVFCSTDGDLLAAGIVIVVVALAEALRRFASTFSVACRANARARVSFQRGICHRHYAAGIGNIEQPGEGGWEVRRS